MLSSFETGIITLINNALKCENQPLPEDFDYSLVYKLGLKHQILPMLYYGGAENPKFVASDVECKMLFGTMQLTALSENQLMQVECVCKEFDKNGIEYMKLKGSNIKSLYPKHEMRVMSDADILIREEQYAIIQNVLTGLGYTYKYSSDHELVWKKDELTVELHKRIVPSYQKDFYAYFGEGWKKAYKKNDESCEYVMKPEDEFVYIFTHLAEHYREAGIGIKHMTDIYLFLNKYTELDLDYIYNELEKLKLLDFFKNVKKTLDVWFNGAECDDVAQFITAKIFDNGVYGNMVNALKSDALRYSKGTDVKGAKRKRKLHAIFLPYKTMCNVFPVLNKAPILLPFLWVWRIIRTVLFRRGKIKQMNENINSYSQETIDEHQLELNYVGLDFNYEV